MRVIKPFLLIAAALPLLSCAKTTQYPPLDPGVFRAQPLARTIERTPPFARHIAQGRAGVGGGIGGMIIGLAVNTAINQDDRARSKIGQVPSPENVDPGEIIETMIAEHLAQNFGARPFLGSFYAGSVTETISTERAPQIATLAQRRGLSGLVVDVVVQEFYADSTGRNLGLVEEAFLVRIRAQMTLVDVASGAVVAQAECLSDNGTAQPIINAITDGGSLTGLLAQKAAANCARSLISRALH